MTPFDRRDAVGVLVDYLLAELSDVIPGRRLLALKLYLLAVNIRIEELDESGNSGFERIASRLAGQIARAEGRAVIASVAREDLVASCVHTGDFDRVLVGVGSGVGEKDLAHVVRHEFKNHLRELRSRFARVGGRDIADLLRLSLDRVDYLPVSEADVEVDELRRHIGVPLAVIVPHIDSVGLLDRDRMKSLLL